MGILDWLLTDPSQADGGFLEALLRGGKPGGAGGGAPTTPPAYTAPSSLLGESPLINMLRGGFAGMNAANGYSGFGPQFAAGVVGGADTMTQRRRQVMQDRLDAVTLNRALGGQNASSDAPVGAMLRSRGGLDQSSAAEEPARYEPEPVGSDGIQRPDAPDTPGGCASCAVRSRDQILLPVVRDDADYLKLANGENFIGPDGILRRKP